MKLHNLPLTSLLSRWGSFVCRGNKRKAAQQIHRGAEVNGDTLQPSFWASILDIRCICSQHIPSVREHGVQRAVAIAVLERCLEGMQDAFHGRERRSQQLQQTWDACSHEPAETPCAPLT